MKAKGESEIDWRFYAQRQSNFILRDNLLFLNVTPANSTETMTVFVVPEKSVRLLSTDVTAVPVIKVETGP